MGIIDEKERKLIAIKMADGATLLGQVNDDDLFFGAGTFKFYNPAEIHMQMTREGGITYAMLPFQAFRALDHIEVSASHVQTSTEPNEEMKKVYAENVLGRRVQVPEKKLLLS